MVPQGRHKGGYTPALKRIAQEKKTNKAMDAKIWIYNHVSPLFHSKKKSTPLRASGVAQSLPPPSKMKKFENPTQNKDTDFKLWISSHGPSLFHS